MKFAFAFLFFGAIILSSCQNNSAAVLAVSNSEKTESIDTESKDYWYDGKAEITSYQLQQARYGEIRSGKAVMVFVTEPFSPLTNTKADSDSKTNQPVLKLNFTKNFNTGIYPYSMMTSTFYPVEKGKHSLKVSSSSQEWCGHTYMELVNGDKFTVNLSSYFQGESFQNTILDKELLEDDLWSMIRLNPENLPQGKNNLIPSFFYLRLMHQELAAYPAETVTSDLKDGTSTYSVNYSELHRKLVIKFETDLPHRILSWDETYDSGYGDSKKTLTTSGKMLRTIKSDYWNKNGNEYSHLRDSLKL